MAEMAQNHIQSIIYNIEILPITFKYDLIHDNTLKKKEYCKMNIINKVKLLIYLIEGLTCFKLEARYRFDHCIVKWSICLQKKQF